MNIKIGLDYFSFKQVNNGKCNTAIRGNLYKATLSGLIYIFCLQ